MVYENVQMLITENFYKLYSSLFPLIKTFVEGGKSDVFYKFLNILKDQLKLG